MVDMATLASLSASLADVDLARRTRQDALEWHSQDLEFRKEERLQHARAIAWHEQEVIFRNEERAQRVLINQRREIDEKNEQLRSLANVGALIAGFEVVVLVELQTDELTPEALLGVWVLFCSLTVCLMMFAVITCTLVMVAILKRFEINAEDGHVAFEATTGALGLPQQDSVFHAPSTRSTETGNFALFWASQCDDDWRRSYSAFTWGVNCFILSLIFMGWVRFYHYLAPGIVITVVCGWFLIYMIFAHYKWALYLNATKPTIRRGREGAPPLDANHPSNRTMREDEINTDEAEEDRDGVLEREMSA